MAWFTGVLPDARIEQFRSVTEYDRDGDAQQILRELVAAARPAASEKTRLRLSPASRFTEEDLTHYGPGAEGPEPHITRTASCVDSGPDQALYLHDHALWESTATLEDPTSLHEWLHAGPVVDAAEPAQVGAQLR